MLTLQPLSDMPHKRLMIKNKKYGMVRRYANSCEMRWFLIFTEQCLGKKSLPIREEQSKKKRPLRANKEVVSDHKRGEELQASTNVFGSNCNVSVAI